MNEKWLVPFVSLFPDRVAAETRTLTTSGYPGVPDDEYGLLERYCPDPTCGGRRVLLNVVSRRRYVSLPYISYAFDGDDEWPGPFLDPLKPQTPYADILLELVTQILEDAAYGARLESHYHLMKTVAPGQARRRELPATRPAGGVRPDTLPSEEEEG